MSEEKFSKCEEGGKEKKCKCRISGVRKKKEVERKVPEKKIEVFAMEIKVEVERKKIIRDFYLLGSYPLVGRHVVNEPKVGCHCCNGLGIS